jgi:hypothetical protein
MFKGLNAEHSVTAEGAKKISNLFFSLDAKP